MPTHYEMPRFLRDFARLSPEQQRQILAAVAKFRRDLVGGHFRPGLRVKGVQGQPGVYEMTWAPDGRATFRYGDSIRGNDPHIIWERCGTHAIFDER